ncbi:MAG: hypothetical protein SGI89_11160 [bacterium]|nr:hypothetical protein [bacterium]
MKLEKENEQNTSFVKREPTPLLVYKTLQEKKDSIKFSLSNLTKLYPSLIKLESDIIEIIKELEKSSNALQLLDKYFQVIDTENKYLKSVHQKTDEDSKDNIFVWANKEAIFLSLENFENNISLEEENNINILSNIFHLTQRLRDDERPASIDESILLQLGYTLLEKSQHLPHTFQYLGTYGFRNIQTYLSLADPGEGHINITTESNDLLNGLIVHVEHIDRDKETDKERVEAYRLPSPIHIAKVRLHVGDKTPSTVFVGRPMFENLQINPDQTFSNPYFKTDILKSVHYTAAICNKMFSLGIADCKIAIERMTFTQSLTFMKALVGNCQRDIDLQFLSAAFNINTPIIDDRDPDNIRTVKERFKIALLGIELALLSGFNKVTWDGASKEVPSKPIIGQLSFEQILELVHLAHEKGLETYISAGLKNEHMIEAVYTGVDGVGIGTSLHFNDPVTKLMGALDRNAIKEVLQSRDQSQNQIRGKGAKMLASLDRLHFEGFLSGSEELLRIKLFKKLLTKEETEIESTMMELIPTITKFESDINNEFEKASNLNWFNKNYSKASEDIDSESYSSDVKISSSIKRSHPIIKRAQRKIQFINSQRNDINQESIKELINNIELNNISKLKNIL